MRVRRWGTRLILPLVVLVLCITQLAARSEAVMRGPIDLKLTEVAYALNGRIEVASIEPMGLWGIALNDVVFRPHGVETRGDRPLARVGRVIVYPRIASLATGEPSLARVVIENPRVTAVVRSDGGSHSDWFFWLVHDLRSRNDGEARTTGTPTGSSAMLADLPEIEVRGGLISFDDPTGRYPSVGMRVDSLSFAGSAVGELEGLVQIEGLGRGQVSGSVLEDSPRLSLRLLDRADVFPLLPFEVGSSPDAELAVGSLHLDWPLRVSLADVEASGLAASIPGLDERTLETIHADTVAVSLDAEGAVVEADTIDFQFGGPDSRVLQVGVASVERPWDAAFPVATLNLVDEDGATATMVVEEGANSVFEGRVTAEQFGLAHLAALFPPSVRSEILSGTFDGSADIRWDRVHSEMAVVVDGQFQRLTIESPVLAAEPIRGISASLDLSIDYWVETKDFLVERLRVLLPDYGMYINASGSSSAERRTLELHASLPPQDAQTLLDSLPDGVADTLQGCQLAGNFGFEATVVADTDDIDSAIASVEFALDDFELVEFGPQVPIHRLGDEDFTWQVSTFEGDTRMVGPGTDAWVPWEDLAALTYRSVVAAEDDRYWDHSGFDHAAILAAIRTNMTEGRVVRGGSTISQQVVKNLFLNHDRTLDRKLQEAFLAWQLEQTVSKRDILEFYLNLVHWGPGTYGIRDASMAYFNHMPSQLTLRESTFLAAILPNPALFGSQYTEGIISPSRRQKMLNVLTNLHRGGYLSEPTRRYHASLVEQGTISNTPPPRALGVHVAELDALPPRLHRLGSLFFE